MLVPFPSPFGVSHPLGLPRPIDADNFFGAQTFYFTHNLMPIPSGCLAHFDGAVYRPYVRRVVAWLASAEFGWAGPAELGDPPRYGLLRDGAPAIVPADLRPELPPPPAVRLQSVLTYFDRHHARGPAMQLLDLLTLIEEDLGPSRFAEVTAAHPWTSEYLR